jgi:ligand-binding SRPBCC domain-containing protein
MAVRLEFEQWVPFPIARVFTFFSDPDNLPRIMPPSSRTRLLAVRRILPTDGDTADSKAAGIGSTIVTSFRILPALPLRAHWVARVTEFQWNHHFSDVQESGPFKKWSHRHEFASEARDGTDGTLVSDRIEYEIGMGFAGSLAERFFVRRQMQQTFLKRQERLPNVLSET